MIATLEFDAEEERGEFEDAVNGYKYKLALWDISQVIRNKLKYGDLTDEQDKAWESISESFWNVITEYNFTID